MIQEPFIVDMKISDARKYDWVAIYRKRKWWQFWLPKRIKTKDKQNWVDEIIAYQDKNKTKDNET